MLLLLYPLQILEEYIDGYYNYMFGRIHGLDRVAAVFKSFE